MLWFAILRVVLGICFLVLGIVGLFLPILQGWLFLLLAAMMFFPRNRYVEKVLLKASTKLPRVVRFLRNIGVGTALVDSESSSGLNQEEVLPPERQPSAPRTRPFASLSMTPERDLDVRGSDPPSL